MKKENKLNNEKFELMEINEFIFKKYNSVFDDYLFYEKNLKLNSNQDELMSEKSVKKLKKHRPLIFLSSTSWTPDEDFDILLNAVVIAEKNLKNYDQKIVIIITGRGPMKDQFFEKVSKLKLKIFQFKSIWLDSDDYPKILSMSDLGICLHYSSSGYDLPMKVVDMFSSGLPVLAVEYKTIHELVKNNINGFTFKNEEDLANLMVNVIQNYNNGVNDELNKFRENIENEFSKVNWITQWKNLLGCVLFKSKIN
jgi:beta-1,4-mannosyltransferase